MSARLFLASQSQGHTLPLSKNSAEAEIEVQIAKLEKDNMYSMATGRIRLFELQVELFKAARRVF